MSTVKNELEEVIICLEQKKLFITDVMDLTKQIEVQSNQEDMELDNLLEQRQAKIERMMKCDDLIQDKIGELDSQQQEHWEKIINGEQCSLENEVEKKASEHVEVIKELTKRTVELQKIAMDNLKAQYEEARDKLSEIRKNNAPNQNIFN